MLCYGIGIVVVERIGRRNALQIAYAGQAVAILPITVTYSFDASVNLGLLIAFEVFGFLFLGFAGLGFGMSAFCTVEIDAQRFRARGTALAVIVQYVIAFGMEFAHPPLQEHKGWPAVFLAVNALAAWTTYLLYPETTGRSLEWLDHYLEHARYTIVTKHKASTKVQWTYEDENIASHSFR